MTGLYVVASSLLRLTLRDLELQGLIKVTVPPLALTLDLVALCELLHGSKVLRQWFCFMQGQYSGVTGPHCTQEIVTMEITSFSSTST